MINGHSKKEPGKERVETVERAKILVGILNGVIERLRVEAEFNVRVGQAVTISSLVLLQNKVIDAAIRGEGRRQIERIFFEWRTAVGIGEVIPLESDDKPVVATNGRRVTLQATGEDNSWLRML